MQAKALSIGQWCLLILMGVVAASAREAQAQGVPAALGTAFTYQGRLTDGSVPANGTYDLQFALFDDPVGATQIGSGVVKDNVNTSGGLFTVELDFGTGAFDGQARYLEIGVRPGASTGAYIPLGPRQALTATPYALFAAAPWVTSGNTVYYNSGNVSIGSTNPSAALSVVTGGAPQPVVLGYPTGLKVGTASGTVPLAVRQNGAESGTPALAYFETEDGDLGSLSAAPSTFVVGAATDKGLAFNVNGTTRAMTIEGHGRVGIGTTTPFHPLHIRGPNVSDDEILHVENSIGARGLTVFADRQVAIGTLAGSSTTHACLNSNLIFAACSSAAEYVPSIDGGHGFPEMADVVSIAPPVTNPYGDSHGPFTVQKSSTACDPNLLGFIVDPESGADGKKVNDHYLPLAIYGYFPAKVTLENGVIRRGDPLTSSSSPGHAMKATQACKTIGYALEDAEQEGTIQVFAQHGENAASEVRSLRAEMRELQKQNEALAARLDALERGRPW